MRRRQFTRASAMLALLGSGSLAAVTQPPAGRRHRILLDTDIGSDIDDAVALAYLLRQPHCELLGISTVTGDALGRARLADALCRSAGVPVPIFPGREEPLQIPSMQPRAPQTARLRDASQSFETGRAIEFLRETIRANPHEVTLLAIGPLTNIATLFELDPEIPTLLRELMIMGGKYSDYPTPWGPTEWNIIVDPHAAARVFDAPVPRLTAVGLDITWQVSMTPQDVAAKFRGDPLLELVLDWSSVWFAERDLLHFHDPLAAAVLFNDTLCEFARGEVHVDLNSTPTAGVTSFQARPDGRHRVAVGVQADAFFAEYFERFEASSPR